MKKRFGIDKAMELYFDSASDFEKKAVLGMSSGLRTGRMPTLGTILATGTFSSPYLAAEPQEKNWKKKF